MTNLGVVVQTTEKRGVKHEQPTQELLVEAELSHLTENTVNPHFFSDLISSSVPSLIRNILLRFRPPQLVKWVSYDDGDTDLALRIGTFSQFSLFQKFDPMSMLYFHQVKKR